MTTGSFGTVSAEIEVMGEDFEHKTLEDLAAYGVTVGEVESRGVRKQPCGMVSGDGSAQWLWEVWKLGFEAAWTVGGGPHGKSVCQVVCPGAVRLDTPTTERIKTMAMQVSVVFVSGDLPQNSWVWGVPSFDWFVTVGKASLPVGWRKHKCFTRHSRLGGITDHADLKVTLIGRRDKWRPVKTSHALGHTLEAREWAYHDVMTAVDDVTWGVMAGAPGSRQGTVTVQRVGDENLWLGTGLLPLGAAPSAEFMVPCVMTKTRWCRRALSLAERWKAHDVPEDVIRALGKDSLAQLTKHLLPGKCMEESARLLLHEYRVGRADGEMIGEGLVLKPLEEESSSILPT